MRKAVLPLLLLMLTAAAPAPPHLDGVWLLDPGQGPGLADDAKAPAPLTAAAKATYAGREAALAAGHGESDPTSRCLPLGFPRNMTARFPLQVLTDPAKVTLIFPNSIRARRVFLDRRTHDPDIDPQFNGDSIGHWEGPVLVVDTTNFKAGVWLDGRGLPSSEALHVTERLRLIDGGKRLEDRITMQDPALFTRAWTVRKTYSRQDDEAAVDALCEELSVGNPRWAAR